MPPTAHRDVVLGRWPYLVHIALLGFTGFGCFVIANERRGWKDLTAGLVIFSIVLACGAGFATMRVVGTPAGELLFINAFTVARLPVHEIASVEVRRGLGAFTHDGKAWGSSCFAPSAGGDLLHYRRAHHVLPGVLAWVDQARVTTIASHEKARLEPRLALLRWLVAAAVLLGAVAAVAAALR